MLAAGVVAGKTDAADAHAAHERSQHHTQRDRGRADDELQHLEPDDLIDECGASATDEQEQQQRQKPRAGRLRCLRSERRAACGGRSNSWCASRHEREAGAGSGSGKRRGRRDERARRDQTEKVGRMHGRSPAAGHVQRVGRQPSGCGSRLRNNPRARSSVPPVRCVHACTFCYRLTVEGLSSLTIADCRRSHVAPSTRSRCEHSALPGYHNRDRRVRVRRAAIRASPGHGHHSRPRHRPRQCGDRRCHRHRDLDRQ